MHGEYKMPGGKLVVADVAVAGGRLAQVQISGDFFLEPDAALDAINHALTGHPVPTNPAEVAHAIDAALGADVVMYGISCEAIAVAVLRALEAA
jgi:lipoate-protein ligase A